jgi:predicted phage terminase large subunit-like protein
MQRLHVDDLTGWLLENEEGWEVIKVPATAPFDMSYQIGKEIKQLKQGELLNPLRLPQNVLDDARRTMGSASYSAQFQQEPVPAEGSLVKDEWLRQYRSAPEDGQTYISVDTAMKASEYADFSVMTVWRVRDNNMYLLDVIRGQWEYPTLKKRLLEATGNYQPTAVIIEDKSSGTSLLQDLKRDCVIPCIAVNPLGDKVIRMSAAAASLEAGRVHVPEHAHWLADFKNELLLFPHGKNDDQVDSLSQFINWFNSRQARQPRIRSL